MHITPTTERKRSLVKTSLVAFAAASALVLAGCAGGGGETANPSEPAGGVDPTAPEVTDITGLTFRAPIAAGFVQAEIGGAGEKYGLDLTKEWIESSATAVTQVVAGDVQVAQSSYFGVIDAANQGIDVVIVSESYASSPGVAMLETLPDSGIKTVEDLIGKTVAVVSLNSSHAVKIKDALIKADLDPEDVNMVELPYGEVPAALQQGTVDASSAQGAVLAQLKETLNTETVFDYGDGEYEGMAESGWIMKKSFAEANPNTVAAIQCAILQGTDEVMDDETYRGILSDVLEYPAEAVEADVSPAWGAELRMDSLQQNADILHNIGALDTEFDMESIVIPQPDNC